MKRSSTQNLPSLQQNNILAPTTRPKVVKQIEEKLSHHDDQIMKNQKIILALANDFKIIKEELKLEQSINQQKEILYQNSLLQLSKLNKKNKQLKLKTEHLESLITEKTKELQGQKALRLRQKLANNNQNQQQIQQLQKSYHKKEKQIQQLKKTVSNLQTQNANLKEKINPNKIQQRSSEQLKKIKQQLEYTLNQNKQKITKITLLERQNSKYLEDLRKNTTFIKQHTNCEVKFQQVKKTNEVLIQKNKSLQRQIIDSQNIGKKFKDQLAKVEQQISKITEKKDIQINQITGKFQKERKTNENNLKIIENLKQQIDKIKIFEKKYQKISTQSQQIKKKTTILKESLICDFCKKVLSKPVTSIPCGHSYCIDCKKGYEKECKRCVSTSSNGIKREAVYRNQLLDQIVDAYNHLFVLLQIFQK